MNHLIIITLLILAISCSNQNKDLATNYPDQKTEIKNPSDNTKKNNNILISELSNNTQDILSKLNVDKFKDKVVYVDIWATWCRPCLAEIPYSKILESKFEGKNIAFITLCCSSKQENWEKIVNEYDIPGEHHLLNENQCMYMRDKYHLVSFPTFMIFNKGDLIYADAPRPSSNELEGILNELIN